MLSPTKKFINIRAANVSQSTNNLASYIWSLADLLRGDFKQSQYGRIILPFTLLRRLECVLKAHKADVLAEATRIENIGLPEEAKEKLLLRASKLSFYNTSEMDLSTLGATGIKDNLESYIQSFSTDAREIFEHFKFGEFIAQLSDANLLYKAVQQVKGADLRPETVSNHDMGLVFLMSCVEMAHCWRSTTKASTLPPSRCCNNFRSVV